MSPIDSFLRDLSESNAAYGEPYLHYLLIREQDMLRLVQGRLYFEAIAPSFKTKTFETSSIYAIQRRLSGKNGDTALDILNSIASGGLETLFGKALLAGESSTNQSYVKYHPEGLKNQTRLSVLRMQGARWNHDVAFDWELKGCQKPFDSMQELAFDFRLGPLAEMSNFEAVAFSTVFVDLSSEIEGTTAKPAIRLAPGLARDKAALGYKLYSNGSVQERHCISGSQLTWSTIENGIQLGVASITIPRSSVLQCFSSYSGRAQNVGWMADPTAIQNPRRSVYDVFDPSLQTLKEFLNKGPGKGNARDLENGVSWLFWLAGFGVAHLGGNPKTQDAADLVITTPYGHFGIVECTTGFLKSENKLPLLLGRSITAQKQLESNNQTHLRVLPIIVSSKPRNELEAEFETAERLGIYVLTREDLEEAVNRTLLTQDPEALYEQAEQAVRAAKAKYETSS